VTALVGWIAKIVFLDSDAAFRSIQLTARDSNEPFAISEPMLRKRLHEKGLLKSIDKPRGTLTVRRRIGGRSRDVLHLNRTTVLGDELSDAAEDADV